MKTRVLIVLNFCFVLGNGLPSVLETAEIIQSEGYVSETHGILTPDGYQLEAHRIPFKRNQTEGAPDRPVVLLMHGLLGASNTYIALGPEYSIAYNLADAGFDVWMGNARGTKNSRAHLHMDPDGEERAEFFDFTWEQIGCYDISSMVDYILEHTNNEKLHYIGHSQGGTVWLVLNSMRPEYNDKFISTHLLAGVGYMEHFPNRLLGGLAMFTNSIYNLALRMNVVELFPPLNSSVIMPNIKQVGAMENYNYNCGVEGLCRIVDMCTGDHMQKHMCQLFGIEEILTNNILDNILTGLSAVGGAALKQIAHYGQNIQDKTFRRWNYGSRENFQIYGSSDPPLYDLGLITVNLTMHYTVADNLLDEMDVFSMCVDIPNCVPRKVARETFGHADFIAAEDVKVLVTDYIIETLWNDHKEYEANRPIVPPSNVTDDVTNGSSLLVPSAMIKICLTMQVLLCFLYSIIK